MSKLLWFRNDIRIDDNPALQKAIKWGVTKAIFFVTEKQWREHHWSSIKIDFLLRHVALLKQQLKKLNIDLHVIQVDDFKEQISYINELYQSQLLEQIFANSELELNEVNRDKSLIQLGVNLSLFEADVIVPKGKIINQVGEPYKVFTPFAKAWLKHVQLNGFSYLPVDKPSTDVENESWLMPFEVQLDDIQLHIPPVDSSNWPLVNEFCANDLAEFFSNKIEFYQEQRDIPGIDGTSKLSPYLAIGAISPRYILMRLMHCFPDILFSEPAQPSIWLNEIIWREFYRNLLFHFPRLCKFHNYNEKYNDLKWLNDNEGFKLWCQGKTGYPLVDAAMRQLNETGWMHNRLRMVVASFLTKHLLIDWRWGEQYFMQNLIDGDLASNNGGWQWAASTGCDAQPYFRVFNPIRQSQRFDPEGSFIRIFLPELKDLANKDIHFPNEAQREDENTRYWPAIVDHKAARLRALACFKSVGN